MAYSRESDSPGRTEALIAGSEVISKKWNPAIVGLLSGAGPLGFNELQERLDVSAKVLSDSLEDLQDHDVVVRRVLSESPLRVEYDLTPTGKALVPVVDELAAWARSTVVGDERTVLVVDGDARVANMHADWIDEHFETRTATSGPEALEAAELSIDVVVVDTRLTLEAGPIADVLGQETGAPVLVLTSMDPGVELLDRRCDAFIQKPTDPQTLVERVDRLLSRDDLEPSTREYLSLLARRDAVRSTNGGGSSDALERVESRIRTLRERIDDETLADIDTASVPDAR